MQSQYLYQIIRVWFGCTLLNNKMPMPIYGCHQFKMRQNEAKFERCRGFAAHRCLSLVNEMDSVTDGRSYTNRNLFRKYFRNNCFKTFQKYYNGSKFYVKTFSVFIFFFLNKEKSIGKCPKKFDQFKNALFLCAQQTAA